uniref:Uncharacterized protein n=1 Tax=Anopheles farauti TaxID=69004 RepID=A0A182QSD2_9DIPT
ETKNRKLQQENNVLVEDVANFRVQFAQAEEGRLRCKAVLEKEIARNHEQYEAQMLLKKRYNDLIRDYPFENAQQTQPAQDGLDKLHKLKLDELFDIEEDTLEHKHDWQIPEANNVHKSDTI